MKITPYNKAIQKYNDVKVKVQRGFEKNNQLNDTKVLACDDKSINKEADIKISKDYQIYEKSMKKLFSMEQNDAKLKEISELIEKGEYKIATKEIANCILEKCK